MGDNGANEPVVSVRPMTLNDLDAVMAIEAADSHPWTQQQMESELSQPTGWQYVACDKNGQVTGFICGRRLDSEAEILKIAVYEKARCQGIGGGLFFHVLNFLKKKGVSRFFLEVRASNLAAKSLYLKAGFCQVSVRKKYYSSPVEDGIIMQKQFDKGENS